MSRRVTLKEVARHAGVSYQTVSKVINHQTQVSKETERRIWESVHTLGYRPNLIARSLRSQRSNMIGYSWEHTPPDQANPILDRFLQSMATAAENAHYHLLAFPHRPGNAWINAYQELIDTNRVDGFVLSSVEFDDRRVQFLKEREFPFVAFGRSNSDWDFAYVDVDGGAGMRMVAEHLIQQGHRRFGVLAWPEGSRVGQNRMEGLQAALAEARMSISEQLLSRGEGVFQFGWQATRRWLDLPVEQRPTAIIAMNDIMAIGAMRAAQDCGLKVGSDLAITGFDDAPMVQYLNPPLTSVRQPAWEVGEKVMELLLAELRGERPPERHILLAPQLIVRESSCCSPQEAG
jgi:DNA-binding LacI/PurR family transcriptional regulator